jgi:hypothetical protein
MANLNFTQDQTLQKAIRDFQFVVVNEISKANGLIGADITNVQTGLTAFKTSLSGLGFTIS